jgi:plasmid stability protein
VKNLTVSLDDETYRNARVAAAADDTSVTAVVRDFLRRYGSNRVQGESEEARFERLWKRQQELREQFKGFSASDRLSREDLYDRSKFR